MKQETITIFQVITIISPFIASYLTYLFVVKSKIKDVDIEKERHLHTTLSFLLMIWHDLRTLKSLIYVLRDKSENLIFPKKIFSVFVLGKNLLSEDKFKGLKESIEGIKKYDAITYFYLEGAGEDLNEIKTKYIFPFLEIDNIDDYLIEVSAGRFIDDAIENYEGYIVDVASLINNKTKKKVKLKIIDSKKEDRTSIINELNINYYQYMLSIIPEGTKKPSYDEFLEEFKTEEFQKIIELQIDVFKNNGLSNLLKVVSENPNIPIEEGIAMYNQSIKKSE